MFSIWTAEEKKPFPAPFSGLIAEVNGEVEINPDLANDSAYDLGWIIILEPHDLDLELLLDPDEYVEYLAEL
jgi:glycine cleavage system H protein